jgi:hypothetical protein
LKWYQCPNGHLFCEPAAFRMYGLNGRQGAIDWDAIRGRAVVFRMEPSAFGAVAIPVPFRPRIEAEELLQTLRFFRRRDARDVAIRRDALRFRKYSPAGLPLRRPGAVYFSPAAVIRMDEADTGDL